ncbi:MAG: hypothetical protein J6K52_01920, partial [Clostridia bacterium]|nr:hypothetical protein [Clostridia bacterium]
KVIAENGLTNIYSIDIQKAAYNKKIEIIASVAGVSALLIVSLVKLFCCFSLLFVFKKLTFM